MLIWLVYWNYWNFSFINFYYKRKFEQERANDNIARKGWKNHAATR